MFICSFHTSFNVVQKESYIDKARKGTFNVVQKNHLARYLFIVIESIIIKCINLLTWTGAPVTVAWLVVSFDISHTIVLCCVQVDFEPTVGCVPLPDQGARQRVFECSCGPLSGSVMCNHLSRLVGQLVQGYGDYKEKGAHKKLATHC
jgi:hypothetical protein